MNDKMNTEALAKRYAEVVLLWGQGKLGYAENGTRMTRCETLPTFSEVAAHPTWYDEFTPPELPERVLVVFAQDGALLSVYRDGEKVGIASEYRREWYHREANADTVLLNRLFAYRAKICSTQWADRQELRAFLGKNGC